MKTIPVPSAKLTVVFRAGALPSISPNDPVFDLVIGDPPTKVSVRINPKAARKLVTWAGGAVLQGTLKVEAGRLVLDSAGFTFLDPKPATMSQAATSAAAPTGNGSSSGLDAPQSRIGVLEPARSAPGSLSAVLRRPVAPKDLVHQVHRHDPDRTNNTCTD